MIYYKDNRFGFIELFNDETGTLIRSNILDNGIETGQLPSTAIAWSCLAL